MHLRLRVVLLGVLCVALVVLAVVWRGGALDAIWEQQRLEAIAAEFAEAPWLPLAVFAAVVVGQQLAVPQTLMTAAAVVVLGPWQGYVAALAGTMLGAVITFEAGRHLGRSPFRRYGGQRVRRLSRFVGRRGVKSMIIVNLVPIGPHTLVNVAAGTSHIRLRDFILGTVIGIAPVTGVVTGLTYGVVAMERMPSLWEVLLGMLLAAAAGVGLWLLSRRAWAWLAGNGGPPAR